MRLSELEPCWIVSGDGRHGMGVSFLCPVHQGGCYLAVWFANPVDGGLPHPPDRPDSGTYRWHRVGETFESLTLSPSIDAPGHWHGFVKDGAVT